LARSQGDMSRDAAEARRRSMTGIESMVFLQALANLLE
jgi:hypothetical protein